MFSTLDTQAIGDYVNIELEGNSTWIKQLGMARDGRQLHFSSSEEETAFSF